jgi:hypothetical protein
MDRLTDVSFDVASNGEIVWSESLQRASELWQAILPD